MKVSYGVSVFSYRFIFVVKFTPIKCEYHTWVLRYKFKYMYVYMYIDLVLKYLKLLKMLLKKDIPVYFNCHRNARNFSFITYEITIDQQGEIKFIILSID